MRARGVMDFLIQGLTNIMVSIYGLLHADSLRLVIFISFNGFWDRLTSIQAQLLILYFYNTFSYNQLYKFLNFTNSKLRQWELNNSSKFTEEGRFDPKFNPFPYDFNS